MGTFLFLIALPNVLGTINITTPWGFKMHFFQIAIFLAAALYGPQGGMFSGFVGSVYSAFIMGNPWIMIGNAILGFFAGLFLRYGFHTVSAVLLAYAIQLPWLILSDYYFVHLPMPFIRVLVVALLVSDTVWAVIVHYSIKPIKRFITC